MKLNLNKLKPRDSETKGYYELRIPPTVINVNTATPHSNKGNGRILNSLLKAAIEELVTKGVNNIECDPYLAAYFKNRKLVVDIRLETEAKALSNPVWRSPYHLSLS